MATQTQKNLQALRQLVSKMPAVGKKAIIDKIDSVLPKSTGPGPASTTAAADAAAVAGVDAMLGADKKQKQKEQGKIEKVLGPDSIYSQAQSAVSNKLAGTENASDKKKEAARVLGGMNQTWENARDKAVMETKKPKSQRDYEKLNKELQEKLDSLLPYKKETSLRQEVNGANGGADMYAAMGMPFSAAVWNAMNELSQGDTSERIAAPLVGAAGTFIGGAADIITNALTWSNNGYKRIYNHIVNLINQNKLEEAEELLNAMDEIKKSNLEYQKAFDKMLGVGGKKDDDLYIN